MTLTYDPESFDGSSVSEGYDNDEDSGFSNSVENLNTFTGPSMSPGEYWQISAKLTLSDDPGSGPVILEIREDGGGSIIARDTIAEFGGVQASVTLTIPTYVANGDFSGPASSGARPEIKVNNVAGSTINWFVDVQSLRLRDEIDTTLDHEHTGKTIETFDSGRPA